MRRLLFMEKEQIFDRRKNLKLKGSWRCNLNVSLFAVSTSVAGVFTKESESLTLTNGHKYSKSRRVTDRSPSHRIASGFFQATWSNDENSKWMLRKCTAPYSLHVPIFQHDTCRFPSPILRIYLQGLSCLPWVSQMSHRLWEKRRYHRQRTWLQLHQSCSRPFWHETFVHVALYGSGISAGWKICGISALAYRQGREPFCCCCNDWLLHMCFQYSNWWGAQFPQQ